MSIRKLHSLIKFLFIIHSTCLGIIPKIPEPQAQTSPSKRHVVLDPDGKFHVEWEVCEKEKKITFEVKVKTKGYVGFGISPTGEMKGADIIVGGVNSEGKAYFQDRHGVGNSEPPIDTHQDWTLLTFKMVDGVTYLKFSRPLETCDDEDVPIKDETQRFIWAFGEHERMSYHGDGNRGSYAVNILDPAPFSFDVDGTIEIKTTVHLPASEKSLYWCSIVKSEGYDENIQIIAMGPKIKNALALKHTHHLTVRYCTTPPDLQPDIYFAQFEDGNCFSNSSTANSVEKSFGGYAKCKDVLYSWAIGGRIMYFPENVGLTVGQPSTTVKKTEYFLLEIHLDNPGAKQDVVFETGVELYYTDKPRSVEAGMFLISVPAHWNALMIPPNTPEFKIVSHCSPDCTRYLGGEKTVFNVQLHAHNTATKMRVRHFRGKTELPFLIDDENYSNKFQDSRNIKEVKILPGDHLTLECTYDSRKASFNHTVLGGMSTDHEMCDATMLYYPKGEVINCGSISSTRRIQNVTGITGFDSNSSDFDDNLIIDEPISLKGLHYLDYVYSLEWTEEMKKKLQQIESEDPQRFQCYYGNNSVEGNDEILLVNYPVLDEAYKRPAKTNCPAKATIINSSVYSSRGSSGYIAEAHFAIINLNFGFLSFLSYMYL